MSDEKDHLAAVKALLTAANANPQTIDDLSKLSTLPASYAELHVVERLASGPRRTGVASEIRQWRVVVRAVAQTYNNALNIRRLARLALHEATVTVGGETYYAERSVSDDPIAEDGEWYSGVSEFTY